MQDSTPQLSRRDLFKKATKAAAAAGLLFVGIRTRAQGAALGMKVDSDYDWEAHYWGMVIDVKKCIGCYGCMRACSVENDLGDRGFRTWVEKYTITHDDKVIIEAPKKDRLPNAGGKFYEKPKSIDEADIREQFFVPKLCNHCEDPPCTQVCPVGSTFQSKDGVVLIDHDSCVGCGYCIQSCPYGARFWDSNKLCANKCNFCYHRITRGLQPACVEACPMGVRVFGDLKDRQSEIWKVIRETGARRMKREMGTRPKVYYKDLHREIV
jgi:tetrathionate reductase subunit B